MATESEKPFVCPSPECGQRFTNHDHLLSHQQRHEFTLRFKGTDALLVDQTPTPTRFLRNCEEAGLFQELDDANPFDEDFKSATDDSQNDKGGQKTASDGERGTQSIVNLVQVPVAPPPALANPNKHVAMASAPSHLNNTTAITKQKLLQTIQMKEQQKMLEQALTQHLGGISGSGSASELLAQALKNISPMSEGSSPVGHGDISLNNESFAAPTQSPKRKRGRKPDDEDPEVKRVKFLERNRAAASRCRAKKKMWVEELEVKSKDINTLNQSMQQEISMLKSEVQQLKSILIAHKDCPLIVHQVPTENKESTNETGSNSGVTLLAQLSSMASMSPLISTPIPLVGSVVPNMSTQSISNFTHQQTPEVATDIEICAETDISVSSS